MLTRLTLLLIALLLPVPSWAAPTFFESSCTAASPCSFASNGGTVPGTVNASANRVLICGVGSASSSSSMGTVTMTWNGVSMTQLTSVLNWSVNTRTTYLFGLIAPASGNQTLATSWTGAHNSTTYIGCVALYDSDQSTGWQNIGSDTANSTAADSTVTSANGNTVVVFHHNDNASSTTINQGNGDWVDTSGSTNAAQGHRASVSGSTVVSWTLGSAKDWVNLKVDVIAASGGATCRGALLLMGVGGC